MATISIQRNQASGQEVEKRDRQWEEECYRRGCAVAQQEALRWLQALEQRLHEQRPVTWKDKGWAERTLVTRFGEVRVKRRLYRDEGGDYHFLLDEYLGWARAQAATPSLVQRVVELASRLPFREVTRTVKGLTAGVLAPATIHRLVGRVAQRALRKEKEAWQACFEGGQAPPSEGRRVEVLYLEADGVWVHLQQEGLPYYEVKSAIAYEGWRRLPQKKERYALVGKRVYGHGDEALPFWEAASLEWGRRWDLSQVEQVVIGGDGASWIDEGLEWFPGAVRQRDGFHLARSCHRALGWAEGQGVYQAIREGKREEALKLLSRAKPRPGEHAKKALASVRRQVDKGVDWRRQGVKVPSGARGLGTMESQGDKLIANRMKKRGMSWTIGGAQRMAKVIQLVANGELGQWCGRPPSSREKGIFTPAPQGKRHRAREPGEGLQAKIPALTGPHASRPWVQALRHLAYDSFPVN